ncbi:MAG TPA: immunoglobulin domain-containing protein, partial [Methylomirabilota bacterium]|nr:immunoglobulin domain-containing protein [Methylomirabilota bacterium]
MNLPLPTSSNIPPTVDGYARWNSSGHYLQTRPQTNWYTLLMATLRNDTGSNIAFITLRYDLATVMGNGINATEEIPGHRGYYSFTGATGTWIRVPQFDSPTATDTSPKVATLNLGVWPQNAFLYLLWADVNAIAATAGANQEGGYTIDNFQAAASPAQSGFPSIVSQPTAQTLGYPNQAAFSVEALGSMPLFYQWFKDGALLNGATNSTLTIHNANATQQGSYAVSVSNSFGAVLSSNAPLTVECVGATSVVITNQPSGQSLNSGGTIALTVGVSGSSPLTFQWHRDGLPIVGANSSNYVKAIAQAADSGFYSVIAGNCAGAMTSSVAFIQVIGAPYGLVGLTNHFWRYNQSGTNLGTAWKEVDYDDPSWPSGRGILAREDNAFITPLTNTVLSVTNAAGAGIVTHYFRTTFVVTNDPSLVSLMASNYIDDGAVVYVNGLEAFRYNMPAGDPSNTTTALAANPLGEGVPIVSNIPPNLTVRGTNVLAVEVHQNTSLSTDVVFGLALLGRDLPPGPPAIAVHPASRTVFEGQGLTLSVTLAAGHDSRFQWLKEGVALLSATNSTLLLTNVSFLEAGRYLLTVSNAYGMVTSSVATVNVIGGEAKLRLVEFTNAWRFNQSGPNLGTAWRAPAYDDASWESGPGVLLNSQYDGFPEPTNRVLSLTNSSGTVVTTYYFRVHFALPPGISNVVLSASNLLDDGAVFYVNGFEATRLRMNGVVTATTFAGFALTD